jgi:hypothetical protein
VELSVGDWLREKSSGVRAALFSGWTLCFGIGLYYLSGRVSSSLVQE